MSDLKVWQTAGFEVGKRHLPPSDEYALWVSGADRAVDSAARLTHREARRRTGSTGRRWWRCAGRQCRALWVPLRRRVRASLARA